MFLVCSYVFIKKNTEAWGATIPYLLYVFDWIVGLIKYRDLNMAYRRIRFEQEAYEKESHPYYLIERRKYSWRKYKV